MPTTLSNTLESFEGYDGLRNISQHKYDEAVSDGNQSESKAEINRFSSLGEVQENANR